MPVASITFSLVASHCRVPENTLRVSGASLHVRAFAAYNLLIARFSANIKVPTTGLKDDLQAGTD